MNRRSFFRLVGLGGAGCAVGASKKVAKPAPKICFATYKDGPTKWEGFAFDMWAAPEDSEPLPIYFETLGWEKTIQLPNYKTRREGCQG